MVTNAEINLRFHESSRGRKKGWGCFYPLRMLFDLSHTDQLSFHLPRPVTCLWATLCSGVSESQGLILIVLMVFLSSVADTTSVPGTYVPHVLSSKSLCALYSCTNLLRETLECIPRLGLKILQEGIILLLHAGFQDTLEFPVEKCIILLAQQ